VPTLEKLKEHGLTAEDLQAFGRGDHGARVKINIALRKMGFGDEEIAHFIGRHNVVPEHELKVYQKFLGWTQNPTQADPSGPIEPGQELTFESIAARPGKPRKPKRPDTVYPGLPHNGHVKNLTPQRMIENLMNHGTVFNMADDGGIDVSNANFDPEMAEALGVNNADDYLEVDDTFDADVIDDTLEVSDLVPLEDFEDEVSHVDDKFRVTKHPLGEDDMDIGEDEIKWFDNMSPEDKLIVKNLPKHQRGSHIREHRRKDREKF
jgi:hypothetical protein